MYCMPQEGTEAYLYFPEAEEESAYAVSEIHNSRCPVFADAQSRGLVTEHGKKMQLYADVLGVAGGKEETVQECRMGEDGIHFSAGKGKLQVTGSGQITFRAPEISLDAVQKIGQYKMESMAKEKAGMYGAEVMTLTVSGGLGLIPVGGTVVTLPQLAGAFQLVAGIVTSQNLLFQIEEVLMFCTSGKEMGAPTGNWMHDSARELTEMASTQFAFYGLMNPYTYQRPKITPLPNETGLTVPGGTGVAVVPNGTAPALNPPYLPGQYTKYPAAVQGWAQQALPGGSNTSGMEVGLNSEKIEYYLGKARNNIDSDTVVLGSTGKYDIIAETEGYTYFKMSDDVWTSLEKESGGNYDEIWKVNQQFIDEQIAANKNILLSNDPYQGYYFDDGARRFYQREIDYILSKGYTFELTSDGLWKAVRK